jgi:hypothetical protein
MGQFLSDDAAARLSEALDGGVSMSEGEPEELTSEPTEDVKEEVEDQAEASPEEPQEVSEEPSDDSPQGEEEGEGKGSMHRVPYDRFKSVIDARNQYKGETETLRKQMESMQKQLQQMQQQPAPRQVEQQYQEDPWNGGDGDELIDPLESKYSALETRMNQMAVYQAEQQLEREIGYVQSSYPGVPRELLLQAVVLDGSSDLMSIAENYSVHIASVEEGAIARHVASAKPKRETPPRAAKSGSPRARIQAKRGEGKAKPTNVAEASKALAEFLKRENPFSF